MKVIGALIHSHIAFNLAMAALGLMPLGKAFLRNLKGLPQISEKEIKTVKMIESTTVIKSTNVEQRRGLISRQVTVFSMEAHAHK